VGIDRTIVFADSRAVRIDEKARRTLWDDIFLEYVADEERGTPGWVCKPNFLCDYICYAILPLGKAYLLPLVQLQSAWRIHGDEWIQKYGTKRARNKKWITLGVAVKPDVLYPAIGQQFRFTFTPIRESMAIAS
jgi:hypothetical protein